MSRVKFHELQSPEYVNKCIGESEGPANPTGWNSRVRAKMKELNITQTELAKRVNAEFGVSTYDQKYASNWVSVGKRTPKDDSAIPFPRFEIMLAIAHVLGVDVGYLTGEYDFVTYEAKQACEYTGLSEDGIKALREVTYFEREYRGAATTCDKAGTVISKMFEAQCFHEMITALGDIAETVERKRDAEVSIRERYGEELADKALSFYSHGGCIVVDGDATVEDREEADRINERAFSQYGVCEDERECFLEAVNSIDQCIDGSREYDMLVNAYKYRASQMFGRIIDELYPNR